MFLISASPLGIFPPKLGRHERWIRTMVLPGHCINKKEAPGKIGFSMLADYCWTDKKYSLSRVEKSKQNNFKNTENILKDEY